MSSAGPGQKSTPVTHAQQPKATTSISASAAPKKSRRSALSDFADYVDAEQRRQQEGEGKPVGATIDEVDELAVLEQLNLDDSNTQTKLKTLLLEPGDENIEKLGALVKKRVLEGRGEALFDVGFDNGDSMDLNQEDFERALERLRTVAKKEVNGFITVLSKKGLAEDGTVEKGGVTATVLVRRKPEDTQDLLEIRVAVVGNVDAGKSTMLGVLTKGVLDDGRGKTRVNLFRHKHEIESGRTSSVGMEILGFDAESHIVTSNVPGRSLTWEEIGQRAAKLISFTDLAGHEKYLRTTVFGLLGSSPDFVMLMVAANNGLVGMSKEHLGIAVALNVPVLVVITKIDICPPNILEQTLTQLNKILKSPSARKIPIFIKSTEEAVATASQFVSQRICPIFQVSNVTGEGLEYIRTFLNILPSHGHFNSEAAFEYHVNDCFSVPFVGTVVAGVVKSGVVHVGDTIVIGPDGLGQFTTTTIRSIQRKRLPVPAASAGQSASFALKKVRRRDVRKGMVVLPKTDVPPVASQFFIAEGKFHTLQSS